MAEASERSEWVKRPAAAIEGTNCTLGDYQSLYARSVEDTDAFWAGQAQRLDWLARPTKIANWSFDPVAIKWFEDGVLNICHNAVDRHVDAGHGDQLALIFDLVDLFHWGICYERMDNWEMAEKDFLISLDIKPDRGFLIALPS
mgnify:CR=1 FL=1